MGWLFERPSADIANHWLAILSLAVFSAGLIAAGVLSSRPDLPPFGKKQTSTFVRKACTVVGWIAGLGLLFGIIRLLQIDPATLGRPIWIVLAWIALIAAIAYFSSIAGADRELRTQRTRELARRNAQRTAKKPRRS